MKKIIAFALSFVLILSVFAVPVSAAETEKKEKCPIIFIAGSSIDICDAEGNEISTGFDVVTDDDEGDMTTDKIIETAMNILRPFILEGLPINKWDNYGKALYEELAPIWDETQLDGNGNAKYGTGVSKAEIDFWNNKAQTVNTGSDGTFNLNDYKFRYDWRLSPVDNAKLQEMIKNALKDPDLRRSFEQQIKKSLDLKKAHTAKIQQMEEEISGMKLKEKKPENPEGDTASALKILGIIIAGAILAMIIGNIRRKKRGQN